MFCILSYDISCDRRRNKICKLMKGHGYRVQRSVFECILEPDRLERLLEKTNKLLDKKTDSLRLYTLCANCNSKIRYFGCGEPPIEDGAVVA